MLIYNNKKEFIGIDEQDLKIFGFSDLAGLQKEAEDFADLFVKEPGYIHNFKHVHWIDFVICAESSENQKAMISINAKTYKCILDIKTLYLTDQPSLKSYIITLQNLAELTNQGEIPVRAPVLNSAPLQTKAHTPENIPHSKPVTEKVIPVNIPHPTVAAAPIEKIVKEPEIQSPPRVEQKTLKEIIIEEPQIKEPTPVKEVAKITPIAPIEIKIPRESHTPTEEYTQEEQEVEFDNGYIYDPKIASSELGLPVDLIEEFIEDFIVQAKEFKDGLYESFENGNTNNVKSLSHKLKGVAANLRIEDALEALTIINTSSKPSEIESNLNTFYTIIAKLSGEKTMVKKIISKPIPKVEEPIKTLNNEPKLEIMLEPKLLEEDEVKDENDLLLDFKDDHKSVIPEPFKEPKNEEDDLIIGFKDEKDNHKVVQPAKPTVVEIDDDMIIGFKEIDSEKETQATQSDEPATQKQPEEITILEDEDEVVQMEPNDSNIFIDIEDEIDDRETSTKIDLPAITVLEVPQEIVIKYSKELAASEIGLDNESFNELFEDFIHEAKTLSQAIHSAIEANNPGMWIGNILKFKGMCDNMRVYDIATEIEALMHTQDATAAKGFIQRIDLFISKISDIKS